MGPAELELIRWYDSLPPDKVDMPRADFISDVKRLLNPHSASKDLKALIATKHVKQTQVIQGKREKERIDRMLN